MHKSKGYVNTIACANIKMYPILEHGLNAGRASALVTLVGNEFQEEI